jgi:O-antigen/teichoic acid export membrane protein
MNKYVIWILVAWIVGIIILNVVASFDNSTCQIDREKMMMLIGIWPICLILAILVFLLYYAPVWLVHKIVDYFKLRREKKRIATLEK